MAVCHLELWVMSALHITFPPATLCFTTSMSDGPLLKLLLECDVMDSLGVKLLRGLTQFVIE